VKVSRVEARYAFMALRPLLFSKKDFDLYWHGQNHLWTGGIQNREKDLTKTIKHKVF
jgi:hypothetical protein